MSVLLLLAMAGMQLRQPASAAPPPESRCTYIIRDAAGVHPGEDPNLHVLAQTAADGPFAPVKPAGAVGIQCWRTSIIPAAHDDEVILAHMVLIIQQTSGEPPHRLGALDFTEGHFRFTMRTGTLSGSEQATVDARLAEFNARLPQAAPAPAATPGH